MQETQFLFTYQCDMVMTLTIAAFLLLLGHIIKKQIPVLRRFYIPAPVIGGIIFSILTLVCHEFGVMSLSFDDQLKNLLMMTFFTSIGFTASFRMLYHGGIAVGLFLVCSIILICIQNFVGISLAKAFDLNPLIGLATGSISLTGGHGTSAAFGPVLEANGLEAGLSVAVAAATFGLVAGSMIGGPLGKRLYNKYQFYIDDQNISNDDMIKETKPIDFKQKHAFEHQLFDAATYLVVCMGIGSLIISGLNRYNIVLPAYIGPMIVAAVLRNINDMRKVDMPLKAINVIGVLSLQFFLAMALMTMRFWELASLAVPLIVILLTQTVVMGLFAYFITFRIMGKDYDAAVIACGHCGFGMGATPNAMANMETFTGANGASPKAFFVVPIVGALFIDFVNAISITLFMNAMI